jgi:excisionase family DNA binding protein
MSDSLKPDSLAVTLTVEQLRELMREELKGARTASTLTLLTPEELAAQMKIPVSWVYEQSRQGNIPTHRIGRYIRFDLEEVLRSQHKKQRAP